MYQHVYETGSGVLNYTLDPEAAGQIEEVRLHLSAAGGAGSFTVTLESGKSSEYNIVFNTQDMSSAADEHWQPTRPAQFFNGDKFVFAWPNAGSKTWGLEVIFVTR